MNAADAGEVERPFWRSPWLLVAAYAAAHAAFNYHPFLHPDTSCFFFLQLDPGLFPRDLAGHSTLGDSLFYPLMKALLGRHMIDPAWLFWPYLASALLTAAAVYRLGRLAAGSETGGLIALALLAVTKSPVVGGNLCLSSVDYYYNFFTMPFLLFSVYLFLRERYLPAGLLWAAAVYFHLKNPAAFALAMVPLLAERAWRRPRVLLELAPAGLLLIPRAYHVAKALFVGAGFTAAEKLQYMALVVPNEGIEGNVFFDKLGSFNLAVYAAVSAAGIFLARGIRDEALRRKVLLCQAGVWFAFALGAAARVVDRWVPLGEIVILGYVRASILGVALTTVSAAACAEGWIARGAARGTRAFFIALAVVLFAALNHFYYTGPGDFLRGFFGPSNGGKLVYAVVAAAALAAAAGRFPALRTPAGAARGLLAAAAMYVALKGGSSFYRSFKEGSPHPFLVKTTVDLGQGFERAQAWARENTRKEDLFLAASGSPETGYEFCEDRFRAGARRGVWCQDISAVYGDAAVFREWKRRQGVLDAWRGKPFDEWDGMFVSEKIDYVVSPRSLRWSPKDAVAFDGGDYVVYKTPASGGAP